MSTITAAPSRVAFGWIVSTTFGVIGRRLRDIAVLTLVLICVPEALVDLVPKDSGGSGANLLSSVLGAFFFGTVALITYHELTGEGAERAMAAFQGAASRIGVLFGANILSGLAIFGGLLLLIAPGFFLMVAWAPLTPVVVIERLGVTASLGRAWNLTKGERWLLAGLMAIYCAASLVLFVALVALAGVLETATRSEAWSLAADLLGVLISGLVYPIGAVGSAVIYVALRHAKDGPTSGEVASVFA
jgi:hypothetical protein